MNKNKFKMKKVNIHINNENDHIVNDPFFSSYRDTILTVLFN
jgi:hypothetical protein